MVPSDGSGCESLQLSGDYGRTGNLTAAQRDYRTTAYLQDSFCEGAVRS